ncbi:MAG: DUF4332 domain-containing protein [Ardenticatenaceae bacterium]|nr:DUF4332 domain-containing protein [Ardenticatenaceae bacterium]
MGYYIDLNRISLNEFTHMLKTADLLPSQQILMVDLDQRFETIKAQNITTVAALKKILKTKKKVEQFASATSLPLDYLTVLRRTINSYHPQPRKLRDFPDLDQKTIAKLEHIGIKTTVDLYEKIVSLEARDALKKQLDIDDEEALLLTRLTDVCRIRYVNQAFATLLIHSEFDTVEKIQKANYQDLHSKLIELNEGKKYYRGIIGLNDMKFFVNDAQNVALDIEYDAP